MRLSLEKGFNEDQIRWCFWGSSSDDYDDDDAGTFGADEVGGGTSSAGRDDNGDDGGSVDRVAVASPNTGQVNTQNFNTSAAQTAGMDRVNVNGQTVAVAPSAVNAVASGVDSGDSRISQAIQSQIVGPAQAAEQAARAANLSSAFASPVSTAAIASGYYGPQAFSAAQGPVGVAGMLSDLAPYGDFRVTPRQMTAAEFGLATGVPSPVNLPSAYFDDGTQVGYFGPQATGTQTARLSFYDTPPTSGANQNFLERAFSGFKQAFANTPQALTQYTIDPSTGLPVESGPAMYKSSENRVGDFLGNLLLAGTGASALTGAVDTQEYTPYFGGTYTDPVTGETVGTPREKYQYVTAKGGLASGLLDGTLTPMSEIEASRASAGDDDADPRKPLILPVEEEEYAGGQIQFPEFTPRKYEYQPYVGKFYTIPSRFTKPVSLLG